MLQSFFQCLIVRAVRARAVVRSFAHSKRGTGQGRAPFVSSWCGSGNSPAIPQATLQTTLTHHARSGVVRSRCRSGVRRPVSFGRSRRIRSYPQSTSRMIGMPSVAFFMYCVRGSRTHSTRAKRLSMPVCIRPYIVRPCHSPVVWCGRSMWF